jgi:hypothetical protein
MANSSTSGQLHHPSDEHDISEGARDTQAVSGNLSLTTASRVPCYSGDIKAAHQ